MVNFIVGLIVGCAVGVCVAALCQAAKDADDRKTADLYRALYVDLMRKPNCKDCGDGECPYRPPGGALRVNCPLWVEQDEDDD